MKFVTIVFAFVVLATNVLASPKPDGYTTKFDNINIDEYLNNPILLKNNCNCLLDKGACTPEMEELKSHLPEAIETGCAKCSSKQKEVAEKVMKNLEEHHLEDCYKPLLEKYDSTGEYQKKYGASGGY
ncbi:ejaculatory bulb-specific protein 3-like [Chrysoperla carnea]|uniref:ejaculatory bulb-specific protein 3-like n=1 Tax=Chrysoperla carnea TaxID=189513 RepID=UPI001D098828|nr:ejaculatory bulb-specific protein 3-like [Chrysoperla carnea]